MPIPKSGDAARSPIQKFYTIDQIASLLAVSTRTVRRWIATGALVVHRFGNAVRVAEPDLKAFLLCHRSA